MKRMMSGWRQSIFSLPRSRASTIKSEEAHSAEAAVKVAVGAPPQDLCLSEVDRTNMNLGSLFLELGQGQILV